MTTGRPTLSAVLVVIITAAFLGIVAIWWVENHGVDENCHGGTFQDRLECRIEKLDRGEPQPAP